ncbi:hypothetical protein ABKV19_026243 [Rosa sericea]
MEKPGAVETCPLESQVASEVPPSPSSLPKEGGDGDDKSNMKMKEKVIVLIDDPQQSPEKEKEAAVGGSTSSGLVLDMTPSNQGPPGGSNLELALFNSSSSQLVPEVVEVEEGSDENPAAPLLDLPGLGRAPERPQAGAFDHMGGLGHSHFSYSPYSGFSTHSLYGSYNRSSLGVRMDSMIHKPSYTPWSPTYGRFGLGLGSAASGLGGGAPGWSRPGSSLINSIDQHRVTSLQGLQNNNELGLAGRTATASRFEQGSSSGNHNFGGSNLSALNNWVPPTNGADLLRRAEPPQCDTDGAGLDLSLKL